MGTDIDGYIEINAIRESENDQWYEIVKIGIIAERSYEIFGKLFGVRAEDEVQPLAPSRGVPEGTSNKNELGEYKEDNKEGLVCQSWVDWDELSAFLLKINIHPALSGWKVIFSSMEILAQKYGGKNVRLVVAFYPYA